MRLQGLALNRARAALPPLSDPGFAPARLLLRVPNHLGDAVMAEPAARAIAARFPYAEIHAQAAAPLVRLVEAWPFVQRTLALSARGGIRGQWERSAASRALAADAYDLCVLFPNSFSSALLAAQTGASRILGFRRDAREQLLTDIVEPPPAPIAEHMTAYYWRLAEAVGCAPLDGPAAAPRLRASPEMIEAAQAVLEDHGIAWGLFVAIAPGAAYGPAKQWPPQNYAAVCRFFAKNAGARVALLGTAAERPVCEEIIAAGGQGIANLAGLTDVGTMVGVLSLAVGFVGNDSGAAHVAAALGKSGVAVFGSTSDAHTAPIGPRMRVVHLRLECSPCFQRTCPLGHLNCLRGIPPEQVLGTFHEALNAP